MDPAIKKQVLRLFTYGLYAVACAEGNEVNAFTANWLSQVSFDPPLITVSVEKDAHSLPMIQRSQKFTVNVLRSGQRELAGTLGKTAFKHPDKLQGISYDLQPDGFVILHDALGWVGCEVRNSLDAGDSILFLAEVVETGMIAEGQPLSMSEAGFRHAG
ncbi:flavin reductase family protein [Ktedonospora formicarum]|uniref:Flavin reductase n=1 Tax=Ktedonospora formicarum TaxID=2778364 RepID=A0A8J3MW93_9CHLR|nr:flavin reductase family protein [Ktedonospora formicarum]GHO48433.1 flavin reductase [Ktedonospora formicarum]